jgi:4-amino-4-deoxy-L-arabinose transferase-like glycosyltransferase
LDGEGSGDRPGSRRSGDGKPPPYKAASFLVRRILGPLAAFFALLFLHYPFLRLPYYWDELGYYIPAAMDFYRSGQLIPSHTLPSGHTPLVIIYLALAWRGFGFSPLVTRAAMIALAACTLTSIYALGRRVANREIGCWSVLLLALSPLFFAQSTLAHLDLAAGLFTLLALLALLDERPWRFALASTCAVLSKETAVVLLPLAWIFLWRQHRRTASPLSGAECFAYISPLVVLTGWIGFCHHASGFWLGNREYLRYNLYSTLNPARMLLTLLRRLYETFVGGFNWLLAAGAIAGIRRARSNRLNAALEQPVIPAKAGIHPAEIGKCIVDKHLRSTIPRRFVFLGGGLIIAYLVMLSMVGGAVLPRYLLPIFPPLVLIAVILIWRLPRPAARSIMVLTAGCFVWAWFLNPPYPFPFEDNLAYADFIRLHQQAARFLEAQPGDRRILTAWPASDELSHPFLGYVGQPLKVVAVEGFARHEFPSVSPESFDCLYLYSRRWEPANNWMKRFSWLERLQRRYFDYQPEVSETELAARYHLRLLASFERRGQWARIYVKQQRSR